MLPTFLAASQALERPNRAFLYLQPWNVVSLYGITTFAIYGPVLLVTAVLGYLLHRYLGKSEERRKRRNLYLFLAMPPLFTVVSLLVGIGEMNQRQWFNSRFAIILPPLVISLHCVFLAGLPHRFKKNYIGFDHNFCLLCVSISYTSTWGCDLSQCQLPVCGKQTLSNPDGRSTRLLV